jgi:uncharacterized membrane protein YccC
MRKVLTFLGLVVGAVVLFLIGSAIGNEIVGGAFSLLGFVAFLVAAGYARWHGPSGAGGYDAGASGGGE